MSGGEEKLLYRDYPQQSNYGCSFFAVALANWRFKALFYSQN